MDELLYLIDGCDAYDIITDSCLITDISEDEAIKIIEQLTNILGLNDCNVHDAIMLLAEMLLRLCKHVEKQEEETLH